MATPNDPSTPAGSAPTGAPKPDSKTPPVAPAKQVTSEAKTEVVPLSEAKTEVNQRAVTNAEADNAFKKSGPVPPLRNVQVEQAKVEGNAGEEEQTVVVLHDPEDYAPSEAMLSTAAFMLAQLFDGERSAAEVAEMFEQRHGAKLTEEQVWAVAENLDNAMYLASPRFEKRLRETLIKYLQMPVRPMAHAGNGYPQGSDELRKFARELFTVKDGPGAVPGAASSHTLKGLILPHIDIATGGAAYAHGYKALLEKTQADLFVILGVAHKSLEDNPFMVSIKDFATPLGPVKTDRKLAEHMQKVSGGASALSEVAHQKEHSIEFQAVLMKALLTDQQKRSFEILPVLCGPLEPYLDAQKPPQNEDQFKKFTDHLGEMLEKSGRKYCIIASVDFSHVGPKFGDSTCMTDKLLPPVERGDRKLLSALERNEGKAFFDELSRNKNARHVDGGLAILAMYSALGPAAKKSKLLHYGQWLEAARKSVVTYASMSVE